jgi:RNA polymerase sigma-70 factor (ECF subfamily)
MPDEPEAKALLALMLFHHSRRTSRVSESGDLVTLEDQDRSGWDQAEISEGVRLLEAAAAREQRGPYLVQAAIAQCHATARTAADTNWALIADLYDLLAELIPSDVVRLNWAVAVGMAQGAAAGLERVDALAAAGVLPGYYLLPATRADFLRRLGRSAEAAESYRQALDLAVNQAEQRYLAGRLAEMASAAGSSDARGPAAAANGQATGGNSST